MAKNVIELNGQKYDALTGNPIEVTPKKLTKKARASGPKHLDGFTRRPSAVAPNVSHAIHNKTQRSKTLMRTVVKKPSSPAKIHAKAVAPANTKQNKPAEVMVSAQKPGRVIRATSIGQSSLISKFGKTPPTIKNEVIPVKTAPSVLKKPTKAATSVPPATRTHQAAEIKPAHKAQSKDVFQNAIEHAVSHTQPKLKRARLQHRVAKRLHVSPKFVTFAGATMAVLSIAGVLAYQNMPELAMKVASTRAGLNASLPAYQPAGFTLAGPIKYDHGEVTINYKSNSDERAFDVTQKNSSWNSETLLENYVTSSSQPYQTFQANGRTIYIYEGNKATWVDGGVWFNIDGKTNLNSDQLLRIANSL